VAFKETSMPNFTRRQALSVLGATIILPRLMTSRAAAAPSIQLIGAPFYVDRAEPARGGNYAPVLVNRPENGGFIAAWINSQSASRYDAQGCVGFFAKNTASFLPITQLGVDCDSQGAGCGDTAGEFASSVAPVAFPDGTSLVFFSADRLDTDNAHRQDVFVQRIGVNRQPIGVPTDVNQALAYAQDSVVAARLSNGRALVIFQSHHNSLEDSFDIKGRVFTAGGVPLTPEKFTTVDTTSAQGRLALAPLLNGRSLLSYVVSSGNQAQYYVQLLDSAANRLGAPLLIKETTGGRYGGVGLTPLLSGGCLALWSVHTSLADTTLRGCFFTSAGVPGPFFDIGASRVWPYATAAPSAVAAPDGRIVCMTDERDGSDKRFTGAWILSATGQRLFGPAKLGDGIVGTPSFIRLPSNEYVVAYGGGKLQRFRVVG
jgi:hypothetical protein